MTRLLRLLRRWRCAVAHHADWTFTPWGAECGKCGERWAAPAPGAKT